MKKRPDSALLQKNGGIIRLKRIFFSKHVELIHLAGLSVLKHFFEKKSSFLHLSLFILSLLLSCFFSLLFSSLRSSLVLCFIFSLLFAFWSLLPSSVLSLLLHVVSSFISDLLFFFSGLFFHL